MSTPHHYTLHQDDATATSITSSDADITTALLTSDAPAVLAQQPKDIGDARTHRLLQVPDPGERWHHASRLQHGHRVASQQRRDTQKTRSAIIVISSVFCALTVVSTLALGIFCRKRNTVFVLQKCEQRDYAVAAADDDEEEGDDELSTDCESTTLPTVVTHTEVGRRTSQQRRDLKRASAVPMTPDLSFFCTSQTGKRNRTGSGSMRREKVSRLVASEVGSSWIELDPAATPSTTLPVECTDDDTDDDIKCRVTRDVMSASSLLGCNTSGSFDGDVLGRFQRSSSLDADVCRFALTFGTASSQPLMTRRRRELTPDCTPCRELAAGDVTDAGETPPTHEYSASVRDDSHYHASETKKAPPPSMCSTVGFSE